MITMSKSTLTEAGIKAIEEDAELHGRVAKALGIKPDSLTKAIKRNSKTLTQYNVIELVSRKTGLKRSELLKSA